MEWRAHFHFPQHGGLDPESLSCSQPDLLMVSHFESAPTVFSQRPSEAGADLLPSAHTTSCLFLPGPDENPLGRKLSQINTRPLISSHLLPNAVQLHFINMCIVWAELNQTVNSTSLRLTLNYRITGYPSSKGFSRFSLIISFFFFRWKKIETKIQ